MASPFAYAPSLSAHCLQSMLQGVFRSTRPSCSRLPVASRPKHARSSTHTSATSRRRTLQAKPDKNILLFLTIPTFACAWISQQYVSREEDTVKKTAFIPLTLVGKEPVSSTMSIFHLRQDRHSSISDIYAEAWGKGIWNILFKQPQIQVVRAYTPLPPVSQDHDLASSHDLRFLIRHDPRGEVSSWLHRLSIGSVIEMKGPNIEVEVLPTTHKIVFLAGGTGIATAIQAANVLLTQPQVSTAELAGGKTIHILWASRRREDCLGGISDQKPMTASSSLLSFIAPMWKVQAKDATSMATEKGLIVQELDKLKARYPGQVTVDYFIDEENTSITEQVIAQALPGPATLSGNTATACNQIIVSGPDGFINHFAGPKVWQHGRQEQGPIGGVVAKALSQASTSVEVVKV